MDNIGQNEAAVPAQQVPGACHEVPRRTARAAAFPRDDDALLHVGLGDEGAPEQLSGRRGKDFLEAERLRKDQLQAGRTSRARRDGRC
jgi:hypothetical protein